MNAEIERLLRNASRNITAFDAAFEREHPRDKKGEFAPKGKSSAKTVSTKPPKVFGMKRAEYRLTDGRHVAVMHSKYSSAMRRGSAMSGYSSVMIGVPNPKNQKDIQWDFNSAKEFRGDNHEEKAAKYVKKTHGIDHNPKSLKEYEGK